MTRRRACAACFLLGGCFTAFSARLVHLQVTMHDFYLREAKKNQSEQQKIHARRGTITDIHGEALAQDEPVHTVVVDATVVKDPRALAGVLAVVLHLDESALFEKITREKYSEALKKNAPNPYIVVKKAVAQSVAENLIAQLAQQKLRGVSFEQTATRVYPNGQMLCHVIGYVDSDGKGMDGIERAKNRELCGYDGFRNIVTDRKGNEIVPARGDEHPAVNGSTVKLTINMGLQNIVEQELDAAVKEFRPKAATVIMMDPKTGEILALANRPNFNLNEQNGVTDEQRVDRAITRQVEPGSTFKIVTVAAALSDGIVKPDTMIPVENGLWEWCKLRDHKAAAELSVNDVLVQSSNIGAAKLAMRLGDQKFFEYIHRFGFGVETSVDLPGEITGVIHPVHQWTKISITRMPMGQEVAVTPLQIATAMCVIANGGTLLMPQIIHEITDDAGVVTHFPPRVVRRDVVSESAAQAVRKALCEVVSKRGTAPLARVVGYRVAGKTGTSQKTDDDKRISHTKHVCSFVGFMPAEDPAFVALVLVDEAQTKPELDVGGRVAAPIFSRIGERAARYLGLTPSYYEPDGVSVAKGSNGGAIFRD